VIPVEFTGAWRRESLTLGDGEPHEPQRVIWIQADEAFGDLRLPVARGAETNCFAGMTTWNEPRLRWTHDVGLEPPGGADEGDVEWVGDTLVERGVFEIDGESVPYVEVWIREPGSDGARVAMHVVEAPGDDGRVTGRYVEVGRHSLTVVDRTAVGGAVDACYRRRADDGTWASAFGLGAADSTCGPADRAGTDVVEHEGLRWMVTELPVSKASP
jgi:hypothetical protein